MNQLEGLANPCKHCGNLPGHHIKKQHWNDLATLSHKCKAFHPPLHYKVSIPYDPDETTKKMALIKLSMTWNQEHD